MGVSRGQKLSGIQKQVLSLYRGFLRTARSKPPENRTQIESIVSAEFRRNSQLIDRKNFLHIEYLLRRGKRQLDQLKTVDSVRLSSSNVEWSDTQKPLSGKPSFLALWELFDHHKINLQKRYSRELCCDKWAYWFCLNFFWCNWSKQLLLTCAAVNLFCAKR